MCAFLSRNKGSIGADESLPMVMMTIIKANYKKLVSDMIFIAKFRNPDKLIGFEGYCF